MEKKKGTKSKKDIQMKYDPKVKIKGSLDSVLKVFVKNEYPNLVKRKGNKKK